MEDAGGATIPWELVIGELMWMTSAVAMRCSCSFYHAQVLGRDRWEVVTPCPPVCDQFSFQFVIPTSFKLRPRARVPTLHMPQEASSSFFGAALSILTPTPWRRVRRTL